MKRVLFFILTFISSDIFASTLMHYEGVKRCVDLVNEIKTLNNVGNTGIDQYIATLTKELREEEFAQNCTNISTIPVVYEKYCTTDNEFCKTLTVEPVKELLE